MRRKKTGYILLALLVITGFAGTISGSISGKERRVALNLMKNSSDVLINLNDLSNKQVDFKVSPGKRSIKECIYHIAISENELWNLLQAALNSPANPEKRTEIKLTDEQLIRTIETGDDKLETLISLHLQNTSYKSIEEAIHDFKKKRKEHIKYLKSTTEDLRDHIVKTPVGWVDCYQLCLMIAAHSNLHLQQINEIKEKISASPVK